MAPSSQALAYAAEIRTPPPPGAPYGVPVPDSATPDRSAIYRHWRFRDGPLLATFDPAIRTVYDIFESSATQRPNAKCLGWRPWDAATKTHGDFVWQTYYETAQRKNNFGKGLLELSRASGVTDEKFGVGLWCSNRPEWQIVDLGCMSQSLYTVSIYDTLGPDTTEYIINHSALSCVATSLPHIPALLKLAPRIPSLKTVICLDSLDAGEPNGHSKAAVLNTIAADAGIKIISLSDVEALGAKSTLPNRPPQPEDITTINYTSGTTGNPKGVVLTHFAAVAAASTAFTTFEYRKNDVLLSYLPLAHIYQRVTEHTVFLAGCAVGYFRGDILGLVDDLKLLKPTGFNSVPRLYNRFGTVIKASTVDAPGFKGTLSRHIIESKLASMKLPPGKASNKHMLYDRIWTPKVASALGLQRARSMVTGSAPIDPSLQQFLRAVFAINFAQGYGLTETYSVSLGQMEGDFSAGNCGSFAPTVEGCLESVPDMDYLVTDSPNPRGELLLRGNVLFREYYKNEAETKKAVDADGWFHTGDIAEIDSMGRVKIVDRRKNVLKLAQGEYISPERIENVYLANFNVLAQAYVHGDSTQAFLVAIFGIDPAAFAPFASKILKKTIEPTDLAAVKAAAADPRVRKEIVKELDKIGKKNKFNSYERVRAVHLEIEPFTIDNELLTPTLKLKRPQTAKKFRAHLDRMYEEALAEEKTKTKL